MGKTQKSIAGILSIVVLVMMFQVCPSYAATATYSISKSKLNMAVGNISALRVSGTREKISWSSSSAIHHDHNYLPNTDNGDHFFLYDETMI